MLINCPSCGASFELAVSSVTEVAACPRCGRRVVARDARVVPPGGSETVPIEVLPRDYLPLKRKVGADSLVPTYGFMGAWLTSNDKAIDAFLQTGFIQRKTGFLCTLGKQQLVYQVVENELLVLGRQVCTLLGSVAFQLVLVMGQG